MKKLFTTLISLTGFIGMSTSAFAQFENPFAGGNDIASEIQASGPKKTASEIIISAKSIQAGETFKVALKLSHAQKWHSYYYNDGVGISKVPRISWTLPDGFSAAPLTFPTPHEMNYYGLNSYGYEGVNYFITEITAPSDLKPSQELKFNAAAKWQVCEEKCIDEAANFDFTLSSSDTSVANSSFATELGDYEAKHVPSFKLPKNLQLGAEEENDTITLTIISETSLPEDVKFYEFDRQLDAQKPINVTVNGQTTTITGLRNKGNDFADAVPAKRDIIRGILYSKSTPLIGDRHSIFISTSWGAPTTAQVATMKPFPADPEEDTDESNEAEAIANANNNSPAKPAPTTLSEDYYLEYDTAKDVAEMAAYTQAGDLDLISVSRLDDEGNVVGAKEKTTFLYAMVLIFGGGLILNLMPCVFPVLGVKVLGFVQLAGNDPKKIKLHGIVFTLGVIVSMWILAAIILTIRETSGEGIAWGSQMKNPYFVGSMIVLLALFALNLYGVFEVGTNLTSAGGNLHAKKGYQGSFFSGILTTLIATPCGAPLLATAMTYTLQQSIPIALLLFTVFALGVSAPYLLLSFFPKMIDKLPRPGNWMVTFKKSMAFPLLATCVFLMMAYSKQTGYDGLNYMLWALVILATAAFIYGTWSPRFIAAKKRFIVGYGLSLLFTVAGGYYAYQSMSSSPETRAEAPILVGQQSDNTPVSYIDKHGWKPWKVGKVDHSRSKNRIVWIDYTADW